MIEIGWKLVKNGQKRLLICQKLVENESKIGRKLIEFGQKLPKIGQNWSSWKSVGNGGGLLKY
jgi:hypothetical protein